MRIVFNGLSFVRRVVGAYTWDTDSPVQEVTEPALIAELLTLPETTRGVFALAKDEPLKAKLKLTPDQIVTLALEANVASVADLAALRPSRALADALAAPLDTLKRWVTEARALSTQQET
jgi:hypothetical protein